VKYKLIYYNVPPQEIAKNTAKSLIQLKPPLQKWLELSNSGGHWFKVEERHGIHWTEQGLQHFKITI